MESFPSRFSLERLRRSRVARAVTALAVLSLGFLLSPYCELIDTADAAPVIQKNVHRADQHTRDYATQGYTCPSLDRTPAIPAGAVLPPVPHAPLKAPPANVASAIATAATGWWRVAPRATLPPVEFLPFYLRYAHLLI